MNQSGGEAPTMRRQRFSTRFGYGGQHQDLIIEDAPEQIRVGLREVLAACGREGPGAQREMICKALRRRPDPNNWSYGNVSSEVDELLEGVEWFEFYDLCQMLSEMIEDEHYDSRDWAGAGLSRETGGSDSGGSGRFDTRGRTRPPGRLLSEGRVSPSGR